MGAVVQFRPAEDGRSQASEMHSPRLRSGKVIKADPEADFHRAYSAVRITRAARELVEARWLGACHLGIPEPTAAERDSAFNAMVEAINRLTELPAATTHQLRWKRDAIGKVWLKAQGPYYDRYRRAVAADAARLGVKP